MKLLEEDELYLSSKQFEWEFIASDNEGFLIIKNFRLDTAKYSIDKTDLMIRIPSGYNMAALDCFYVDPQIKLTSNGKNPPAADQIVNLNNRQWQQFSRHFNGNIQWRPGVDSVQTMISLACNELQA